ncbi:MAG: DUF362 domain-containing protein [Muribaculaceae bacterium]|nr:DUF362 domain-containing protein [Muribaculaceae bacterium]
MKKPIIPMLAIACGAILAMTACSGASASKETVADQAETPADTAASTVYYVKEITPENLIRIYKALDREATGNVAVKISTGESNKSNHLDTALIKDFVHLINGTFVECNTAYPGNRMTTADHLKAAADHGFTAIAPVDIMDADGDTALVVTDGFHLPYDLVGKNFLNYDFMVVLSHFKGHQMGGFGGALKNISIGIGSTAGKSWIHSAGQTKDPYDRRTFHTDQDDFLESMADASQAIVNYIGPNVLYINVANRLSVDCDCNGNPAAPEMGDLGIYASLDPVALDRACVDAVFNSTDPGKDALIERINSRHGTHILDAAEQLGVGTQRYTLIDLDQQ